jgi:hypothetical protein
MPAYPTLVVNGVNMYDPRWALADDQRLRQLPGRRGFSVTVPGRSGAIVPRRSVRDSAVFTVDLWVVGLGSSPAARVADLERSLWALDSLFANNGEMFPVQYVAGPLATDILVAQCRRIGDTTPERAGNGDAAKVSFVLEIPSGEWRDPAPVVGSVNYPWSNSISLTGLGGSANEITDAQLAVQGPFNDVQIQDPVTLQYVTFRSSGSIPVVGQGKFVRFDMATMSARYMTGLSWAEGAGSDCSSWVINGGPGAGRSWLPLVPRINGVDPTSRSIRLNVGVYGSPAAPLTVNGPGTRFHYRAKRSF